MLCLCGFELYSRWVPLFQKLCWGNILFLGKVTFRDTFNVFAAVEILNMFILCLR